MEHRAGNTYLINDRADDRVQGQVVPGAEYRVEGLWKDLTGTSWTASKGNPAVINYAMRSAFNGLPMDDDVWYGKIGPYGYLVHESEIGELVPGG